MDTAREIVILLAILLLMLIPLEDVLANAHQTTSERKGTILAFKIVD
jgi:hypothetical protein